MILQRLVELAHREGLVTDPAFEPGTVAFCIEIDANGAFCGLQSLLSPKTRGKGLVGKTVQVPSRGKKTSGLLPRFLCDEPHYALEHSLLGLRPTKRLADEHLSFRRMVDEAARATQDPALLALLQFLTNYKKNAAQELDAACQPHHAQGLLPPAVQVTFSISTHQGQFIFDLPGVASWWRASRSGAAEVLQGVTCIISGAPAARLTQHPAVKKVPKGKPDCALVSFNDNAYESFGLKGFDNAPMSQETADAYTRALNRLLDFKYPDPHQPGQSLPRRRINLAEDTAIVYWASEDEPLIDLFAEVEAPKPERVDALLTGPLAGKEARLSGEDAARFYAMTLSGAAARIVVRDWFETSVASFAKNVSEYFDDVTVVGVPRATLSLVRLLDATVPAINGKIDRKRVHPGIAARLWQDILRGRPFAPLLLQATVLRVRAEGGVRPEQAALLRAYFNRAARRALQRGQTPEHNQVNISMDESNKEPAYLIGRAFAVLEKLQKDAIHGINQTIADRFYGAASATPAVVMAVLIRKSKAHIAKANSGPHLDRVLGQILSGIERFPPSLSLEEQGLFAIGYYHQRQALYTKKDASPDPASPATKKENKS